jgi:hypothetical protein
MSPLVRFFLVLKGMNTSNQTLSDIVASAETGCVLKIKLKDAKNPVITAVDKVVNNDIVLKTTCLYGYPLEKRMITLDEIESIQRYKTYFDSPLFAKLRFIKNNISELRTRIKTLGGEPAERLNPEIN